MQLKEDMFNLKGQIMFKGNLDRIMSITCIGIVLITGSTFGATCPGMSGSSTVYVTGHLGDPDYLCGTSTNTCVELASAPTVAWDPTSLTVIYVNHGYATSCADDDPSPGIGSLTYSKTTGWNYSLAIGGSVKWKPGVVIGPELTISATFTVTYDTKETNSVTLNFDGVACDRKRKEAIYQDKTGTASMVLETFVEADYDFDEADGHASCTLADGIYYGYNGVINSPSSPISTRTMTNSTAKKVYDFVSTDVTLSTCPQRLSPPHSICLKSTGLSTEPVLADGSTP